MLEIVTSAGLTPFKLTTTLVTLGVHEEMIPSGVDGRLSQHEQLFGRE